MQPHQNHEVLMPGRAHAVRRITAGGAVCDGRPDGPCDATTPIIRHQTAVTEQPRREPAVLPVTHCSVIVVLEQIQQKITGSRCARSDDCYIRIQEKKSTRVYTCAHAEILNGVSLHQSWSLYLGHCVCSTFGQVVVMYCTVLLMML